MDTTTLELLGALLVPLVVLVVLRVNAAMVFLSLCLGYVLVQFVANDADSFINFVAPNRASVSASALRLGLLFLPAVLTACITLLSIHGRVRTLINILPAAGVAALAMVLAVPLLTPDVQHTVESLAIWRQASQAQALIIGISSLISLLLLWTQRRATHRLEESKRHRR